MYCHNVRFSKFNTNSPRSGLLLIVHPGWSVGCLTSKNWYCKAIKVNNGSLRSTPVKLTVQAHQVLIKANSTNEVSGGPSQGQCVCDMDGRSLF